MTMVVRIDTSMARLNATELVKSLGAQVERWHAAGVSLAGLEIDHDSPTARLPEYGAFLRLVRREFSLPLSVTALPTWLEAPAFDQIIAVADEVVLQVHAVRQPVRGEGLFSPSNAMAWQKRMASRSTKPFRLALPAYGTRIGRDEDGSVVVVESEAPAPGGAHSEELVVAPAEVRRFLDDLRGNPARNLAGIVWFRLPNTADRRAWSLATLRAVINGMPVNGNAHVMVEDSDTGAGILLLANNGVTDARLPHRLVLPAGCGHAGGANGYHLDTDGRTLIRGRDGLLRMASAVSIACVMDVTPNMLDDRDASVREPITHSFSFELRAMHGAPKDELRFRDVCHWPETPEACAIRIESDGLSPRQVATLKTVRASNGDAFEAADGLPIAVRHYVAGAKAFHAKRWDQAAEHFHAIQTLPEEAARPRLVWATYMLGRTLVAQGREIEAAPQFAATRALALRGLPDPHGLAVASLGEEARIHFRRAKALLEDSVLAPEKAAAYTSAMTLAATLYLDQSVRDDQGGTASLRAMVRHLRGHRSIAEAAVRHPLLRRLMVANTLADFLWSVPDPDESPVDDSWNFPDAGVDASALAVLVAEAVHDEPGPVPDLDRLAALAYHQARYDLAAQLVERAHGPMAAWVRAKLALQGGDEAAAARHYAEAAKAFPASTANPLDQAGMNRIQAETGVLAFSRGEYTQAMLLLMNKGHWGDVAAIGERVLTLNELKTFVDARPALHLSGGDDANLRDLLARRLVRTHRIADALPYFASDDVRAKAAEYLATLKDAEGSWSRLARGEAWYRAAVLARIWGMKMMGTEGAPDHADWQSRNCCVAEIEPANDEERKRMEADPAKPFARFHYRYIAVDHAQKAADMLPPRSQAFAAVLCHASDWMQQTWEMGRSWDIYQRYVREGAHVPFARHFGRKCPTPDFAAAPASERRLMILKARNFLSANRWWAAGLLATVLAVTGWWLVHRRRTFCHHCTKSQ
ncbi:DUF3142 domain-containing protein [Magnetospirillum moscoviense]|uniref:DUF3142 domain-containing protein n=1 Tax=Magnetospirillum moscoviense TaxID=1437059 RepID=UPI001C12AEA6|nr:DUF3142 domain-containing protein [Magnetospirillum moscoviense]